MAAGELRLRTAEAPAGSAAASDGLGAFLGGGSLDSDLMFSFGLVRCVACVRSRHAPKRFRAATAARGAKKARKVPASLPRKRRALNCGAC
jgi:hypothetical protein